MEYQPIRNKPYRYFTSLVALFMLVTFLLGNSLVAFSLQEFAYRSTSNTTQSQSVQREEIIIPITVHIVSDTERTSTQRDSENINRIMQQVSEIWSQADISFTYNIAEKQIDGESAASIDGGTYSSLIDNYGYQNTIQLFFVRELNGIYGVAIPGGLGLVSDIIPAGGFRTTAHEVGHLLGLPHTDESRTRLMYSGATGVTLSSTEINTAREFAGYYNTLANSNL